MQPFTTNHFLVMRRLGLLHAYGETAIFDTIMDGLIMVRHGRYDKKALLVVTDGMDNASQATLQQVVGQARRMGVLIYSIGIGDPNSGRSVSAIGPLLFGGESDHVDAQMLSELSTESGARTFLLREVGDGEAAAPGLHRDQQRTARAVHRGLRGAGSLDARLSQPARGRPGKARAYGAHAQGRDRRSGSVREAARIRRCAACRILDVPNP